MVAFLAAPLVAPAITSAATWVVGGFVALTAGAVTYDMAKRRTDADTQSKTQSKTKAANCKSDQKESDCKQEHSGRIQAQEEDYNYVPARETGSAWTKEPSPPTLAKCTHYANKCRDALRELSGADRGRKFQEGADVAHANLVQWMTKNTPAGIPVLKISFYFDGDSGAPNRTLSKKIGKASKRMDLDILNGEALKGY